MVHGHHQFLMSYSFYICERIREFQEALNQKALSISIIINLIFYTCMFLCIVMVFTICCYNKQHLLFDGFISKTYQASGIIVHLHLYIETRVDAVDKWYQK